MRQRPGLPSRQAYRWAGGGSVPGDRKGCGQSTSAPPKGGQEGPSCVIMKVFFDRISDMIKFDVICILEFYLFLTYKMEFK